MAGMADGAFERLVAEIAARHLLPRIQELEARLARHEAGCLRWSAAPFSGRDLATMARCTDALKQWTRSETAAIVYDPRAEPFTRDRLFEKVQNKPNVAVVAFTTDGDVFGGFYRVAVDAQDTASATRGSLSSSSRAGGA